MRFCGIVLGRLFTLWVVGGELAGARSDLCFRKIEGSERRGENEVAELLNWY